MSRAPLTLAVAAALLLAACGSIGGPKTDVTVYAPVTAVQVDPSWPQADWHLTVGMNAANQMLDTARIAVRPTPSELQTYKGASWADNAPDLLQTAIVEGFEDSGKITSVTRFGGGGRGDVGLVMELRAFETDYASGAPEAVIELQARLVKFHGGGVAARRFRVAVPGAAPDTASMVEAFGKAMSQVTTEVVGWTLVEGNRLQAAGAVRSSGK